MRSACGVVLIISCTPPTSTCWLPPPSSAAQPRRRPRRRQHYAYSASPPRALHSPLLRSKKKREVTIRRALAREGGAHPAPAQPLADRPRRPLRCSQLAAHHRRAPLPAVWVTVRAAAAWLAAACSSAHHTASILRTMMLPSVPTRRLRTPLLVQRCGGPPALRAGNLPLLCLLRRPRMLLLRNRALLPRRRVAGDCVRPALAAVTTGRIKR